MKLSQIVLVGILFAIPASAGPKKLLQNVGHEVKETGKDFILWRHPAWNLMALAEIGADIADAKTTADCQHVPNCMEANASLYGRHPSFHRVALTDLAGSFTLITLDHWAHTHRPEPYIRTADYWWLVPGTIDIIGTSKAAYGNTQVKLK